VTPTLAPFTPTTNTHTEQRWYENISVLPSQYIPIIAFTYQSSGVSVDPDCVERFQELKLRKKYKYITFHLNESKTEIVVAKTSESSDYDDFLADLPEAECRWAVYDFQFQNEEGGLRNKIVFFHWYVGSSTKKKMRATRSHNNSSPMALIKCTFLFSIICLSYDYYFLLSPFSLTL
jgi:cofilin